MNKQKALTRVIALAVSVLAAVGMVATVLAAVTITSETKIKASDAAPDAIFGRVSNSLALSGQTAVVGAYRADTAAGADSGAAYVFTKSGSVWSQEAQLLPTDLAAGDLYGQAVAIEGDVVVIGSYFDDDAGSHSGSAYVFRRVLGVWVQEAKLVASDAAYADMFGLSVSLAGNVAVVGSPYNDDNGLDSGSVYVFRWNGSAWVQEQKLAGSDTDKDDLFGFSVSVEADTAIVGAFAKEPNNQTGASYVFKWNGSAWTQEAKLVASDAQPGDAFGISVDIAGNLAVIGASLGNGNVNDTGVAYVFQRSGTTWTQAAKLTASDGALGDMFGESVTIYGTTVIAGAPRDDDAGPETGAAYIYELSVT